MVARVQLGHSHRKTVREEGGSMKVITRAFLVALVAAVALFVGVSTASAGEVRWFGGGWHGDGSGGTTGGTTTTSPGDLTVSFGWATNSPARTQKFLDYQYVTYSVSGAVTVPTTVTSTGWGPITTGTNDGGTFYVTRWTSPVLANLTSGQSVTVTASLKTTKMVWDDDKTFYKAGTELLGSSFTTCTITAT